MSNTAKWTNAHTWGLILVVAGVVLSGWYMADSRPRAAWALSFLLLIMFTVIAGQGVTGRWLGVLVDPRNKMSLSRFQLVAWTVVILSAYLTAVLARIAIGVADPLAVAIPGELWVLMGISTTSLIGSPLLLGPKKDKNPDKDELDKNVQLQAEGEGLAPEKLKNEGALATKDTVGDASVSDMFKGDETGNRAYLDLAKVQMFFFTIVLVLAYVSFLSKAFASPDGGLPIASGELPVLPEGMIALLGISHAGFLSNKAVSHSRQGRGSRNDGDPPPSQ